jgi:hypothetical protein
LLRIGIVGRDDVLLAALVARLEGTQGQDAVLSSLRGALDPGDD